MKTQPFLRRINGECLEAFGKGSAARSTKVKVFRFANPNDDLKPVNAANEQLKEMMVDGLTGINELPTQANHAEW